MDVDYVPMSCDPVDAFRVWMLTVCQCHVTVMMPSGRGVDCASVSCDHVDTCVCVM